MRSLEVRMPFGGGEKITVKVELANGKTYEGEATTKVPRDVGSRGAPTVHVYEFTAKSLLSLGN